jgi:hypothetical protein
MQSYARCEDTNSLVGVITETNRGRSSNNLWMTPIKAIFDDVDFWQKSNCQRNKVCSAEYHRENLEQQRLRAIGLDKCLQSLNYIKQRREIEDCDQSKIFLLPPNGLIAQKWLISRLTQSIRNHSTCLKISLTVSNNWNENFDWFWRDLYKRVFGRPLQVKTSVDQDEILTALCQNREFTPLVISIHNIDKLAEDKIASLIAEFWDVLMGKLDECYGSCILFLTRDDPMKFRVRPGSVVNTLRPWQKISVDELETWSRSIEVCQFFQDVVGGIDIRGDYLHLGIAGDLDNALGRFFYHCNLEFDHLKYYWEPHHEQQIRL